MDSFSRDDRDRHLITRGNVDGIVSAALFLHVFPQARISFVTSPTAGARALAMDSVSTSVYLSDLALVPELETAMADSLSWRKVLAFDHHQQHAGGSAKDVFVVHEGESAASVLYHHFGLNGQMKKLVAIADLVEYCRTPLLKEMAALHGMRKLEEEARTLDFSWRLEIDDDVFRSQASSHLARGIWPSEVGLIKRRYPVSYTHLTLPTNREV